MDKFKFEDLNVYQKSLDFVDSVYLQIKEFPRSEVYNLSSQFRRAATSIPLNIAEGQGNTNSQFNRFVMIAKSSINECVVCNTIAQRQNYITDDDFNKNRNELLELSKMLTKLSQYLKSQ
jgi:four helix bundle protein